MTKSTYSVNTFGGDRGSVSNNEAFSVVKDNTLAVAFIPAADLPTNTGASEIKSAVDQIAQDGGTISPSAILATLDNG